MAKHRHKRHPLRNFFVFLLTLGALCCFLWWSNHSLQTELFSYVSADLPAGFDGARMVVLSDLHGTEFGENNATLFTAVAQQQPEIIAITGDLIDEDTDNPMSYAAATVQGLQAIAPVYYVTGNHEWAVGNAPAMKELLAQTGATVLDNRYTVWERNGDTVLLAGIDDPNGYADQKTPEELAQEVDAQAPDAFWLLLAHRNDRFADQYSRLGANLVLSGHGHGGIFRLPFTDGLLGTNHDWFPSYTADFYQVNGADLFVSRGLGNVGITFRLLNRPEIAVLTLAQK